MKHILTIAFLTIVCIGQAQQLPTEPMDGVIFPIGIKFVIKLVPTDSVNYNYSVLSFEPFRKIVHSSKYDELFEDSGEDNTIVFYFTIGTHGKTEQEQNENRHTLLIMKSYSKEGLAYTSEMQPKEYGEFEWTSNVGVFPNIIAYEMWPHMIYHIRLKEFKKDASKNWWQAGDDN